MILRRLGDQEIEFDNEGYMVNPNEWTEELAKKLAEEEGIVLTDQHWIVIRFMREFFLENGFTPTVRKITKHSGIETKELYTIFPKGPGKKAARIAGVLKPTGCI